METKKIKKFGSKDLTLYKGSWAARAAFVLWTRVINTRRSAHVRNAPAWLPPSRRVTLGSLASQLNASV